MQSACAKIYLNLWLVSICCILYITSNTALFSKISNSECVSWKIATFAGRFYSYKRKWGDKKSVLCLLWNTPNFVRFRRNRIFLRRGSFFFYIYSNNNFRELSAKGTLIRETDMTQQIILGTRPKLWRNVFNSFSQNCWNFRCILSVW